MSNDRSSLTILEVNFGDQSTASLVSASIREARRQLGLSREAFAARLQRHRPSSRPTVSSGAVDAWEDGTMPPADIHQIALTEAGLDLRLRVAEWLDKLDKEEYTT